MISKNLSTTQKVNITHKLFLGLAIFIGFYLRINKSLDVDFPINDGGLFVQMIEELLDNNFRIPNFTEFNKSQIPYSYPPLGFYLIAILVKMTGLTVTNIIQFLPPIISTISIFIFYKFSLAFFHNRLLSIYSTLSYAIIPQTFLWLIMGGGITRSLGQVFSLFVLFNAWKLFEVGKRKYIFWFALSMSLLLLSHPDSAFATSASILIIFLCFRKNKKSLINLIFTTLLTIIMTSIWWIPQYMIHQFKPLFASIQTGAYSGFFWVPIIGFNFTLELGFPTYAAMGLLGILYLLIKKDYFLVYWFIFMFFVQPRSGARNAIVPFSLMVAYGIDKVLFPRLYSLENDVNLIKTRIQKEFQLIANYFGGNITRLALFLIIFYGVLSSYVRTQQYLPSSTVLSQSNRTAMRWINENINDAAIFLVLPNVGSWELDLVSEWFPYISSKKSIITIQGSEWLQKNKFSELISNRQDLILCIFQDVKCLELWNLENKIEYSYVYISLNIVNNENETIFIESPLSLSFKLSDKFSEIYREDEIVIFNYLP